MFVAVYRNTESGIARRLAPPAVIESQLEREARIRAEARAEALAEVAEQARLERARRAAQWQERLREAGLAAEAVQATKTRVGDAPVLIRHRTYQDIEATACRLFGFTRSEIRSDRRNRALVFARQFVMYWTARLTRLSLPQIGRLMGGRDHTTILHGKRSYVEKRLYMKRHLRVAR